jgi:hypothetical protein
MRTTSFGATNNAIANRIAWCTCSCVEPDEPSEYRDQRSNVYCEQSNSRGEPG